MWIELVQDTVVKYAQYDCSPLRICPIQDPEDDIGVKDSFSQNLSRSAIQALLGLWVHKFRSVWMTNISYTRRMPVKLSRCASQTVKCQVATAAQQPYIIVYHEKVEMYSGPFGPSNMDSVSCRNHSGT